VGTGKEIFVDENTSLLDSREASALLENPPGFRFLCLILFVIGAATERGGSLYFSVCAFHLLAAWIVGVAGVYNVVVCGFSSRFALYKRSFPLHFFYWLALSDSWHFHLCQRLKA